MSEADKNRTANLTIREASIEDSKLLFDWANDASVREVSFNSEPILWDAHIEWFSRRLNSNCTQFYILLENNVPVGQIRYDRDKNDKSAAEISLSIDHRHRGKGLGTEILRLTRERALRDLDCERLTAFVLEGNEASRRAFLRADFTLEKTVEVRGQRVYRFIWPPSSN